jgi:hypothetical protein
MKSKELAYWIGVAQSDGHFKKYYDKTKNNQKYYVVLSVGLVSLEMLKKFKKISEKIFGTRSKVHFLKNRNSIEYKVGCKKLLSKFKKLNISFNDPPKPPNWVKDNKDYFGAYLAGVIDGDGTISITRPQYPQCQVRIFSNKKQKSLINAIKKRFSCNVYTYNRKTKGIIKGRKISGSCYILQFYISKKNQKLAKEILIPNLAISKKRNKINKFLKKKGW